MITSLKVLSFALKLERDYRHDNSQVNTIAAPRN